MEFLKAIHLGRPRKSKAEKADSGDYMSTNAEQKADIPIALPKVADGDSAPANARVEEEEDDDDDLITNEIKRRLKELRRSNFMVLIPEESCPEEEDSRSSEWRESEEAEDVYSWCGFDALYAKYCERMLFFDKIIAQKLQNSGNQDESATSPRSAPKNLVSSFRRLSFKKKNELQEVGDGQLQQQPNDEEDSCRNLETAYVAQICLTWEALHCLYAQLKQRISTQPEDSVFFGLAMQRLQQFQVLLQRFIENEPFEHGSRVEIYARNRLVMPKLLQVPSLQGLEGENEEQDELGASDLASDLMDAMEESVLTFRMFLKMDKKRSSSGYLNLFGAQHKEANSLQHIQNSLDKKEAKIKEMFKRKNGAMKKKLWEAGQEGVDLLFGLVDIKVVSRVLRLVKLSKEHLLWCEDKMSKLDLSQPRLQRDTSPVLFPC